MITRALTALFVPGDRPERFARAAASGAETMIIDLEDAVAPAAKNQALDHALRALSSRRDGGITALVRTNGPLTKWFSAELEALAELASAGGNGLLGLVLPKAEDVDEVATVRRSLPDGCALVPLVESALGVVNTMEIAGLRVSKGWRSAPSTSPWISMLAGIRAPWIARAPPWFWPPAQQESRRHWTRPPTAIKDSERVATDAALGRSFGFGGALCIHPAQLGAIREAYRPTQDEIEWAQKVMDFADHGSAQVDGEMIDRPVIDRARRVMARVGKDRT